MDEPETTTTEEESQTVEPEAGETTESESPPWGDDFDAEKAWNTIQTQRESEKTLKQQAQQQRQDLLGDPEFAREVLDRWEIEDEEEEDEDEEYVDPVEQLAARQAQIEEHLSQQQQQTILDQFDGHLDELASKAEVDLSQRDRRYLLAASQDYGFTPETTERAFKELLEERKAHDKEVIDSYVKGKKNAPPAFRGGTQATEQPDMSDDQQRQKWMTEQLRMAQEQRS